MPAQRKKGEVAETEKSHSHEFLDEPEEHEENSEELVQGMHTGEKQQDVYTAEGREELLEADEISDVEEAFGEGAAGRGQHGSCEHCGKPLGQRNEVVEREIGEQIYFFCSESCASKHAKKHATK